MKLHTHYVERREKFYIIYEGNLGSYKKIKTRIRSIICRYSDAYFPFNRRAGPLKAGRDRNLIESRNRRKNCIFFMKLTVEIDLRE